MTIVLLKEPGVLQSRSFWDIRSFVDALIRHRSQAGDLQHMHVTALLGALLNKAHLVWIFL